MQHAGLLAERICPRRFDLLGQEFSEQEEAKERQVRDSNELHSGGRQIRRARRYTYVMLRIVEPLGILLRRRWNAGGPSRVLESIHAGYAVEGGVLPCVFLALSLSRRWFPSGRLGMPRPAFPFLLTPRGRYRYRAKRRCAPRRQVSSFRSIACPMPRWIGSLPTRTSASFP